MANNESPMPTQIKLLQKERVVELTFDNGLNARLPCEYLRAYSPSADNRQQGKFLFPHQRNAEINIIGIDPIGQYAVKFIFDDGHNTGIYSWSILFDLAKNFEQNWQAYLVAVVR